MRRALIVVALVLGVGLLQAQGPPLTTLGWDVHPSQQWGTPGETEIWEPRWEVETDAGVLPCQNVRVVDAERRCDVALDRSRARTVRLRGCYQEYEGGAPCPPNWSAALEVPSLAPGPATITAAIPLQVTHTMGYRDSTTASGASTTPTVAAPVVQENDIILWVLSVDDVAVTINAYPAGFTQLGIARPSGDGQTLAVAWKRATASEPANYAGTITNGVANHIVQAVTLSGRHLTDPPTISTAAVNNAANNSPVSIIANGVTALDGDDLVWISGPDVRAINIGNGHTPPTNYTEREDAENNWTNLAIATRDNVGAGATGTVTGTFALSSGQAGWAAFLVRIPAAVVVGNNAGGLVVPVGLRLKSMVGGALVR